MASRTSAPVARAVPPTGEGGPARLGPALGVAAGALLISFAPIFVKILVPGHLGPTGCAFWRLVLASPLLFVWQRAVHRPLRVSRRAFLLALVGGVFLSADLVLWHRAIQTMPRAGAGMATVLANTQVVWMALAGFLFLGETARPRLFAGIFLAMIGVTLVAGVVTPRGLPRLPAEGLILSLLAGLFYTVYLLAVRATRSARDVTSAPTFMAWMAGLSALPLAAAMMATGESFAVPRGEAALALVGLVVGVQCVGWSLLGRNLGHLPAALGGLLLLIQPAGATLWASLFFGEAFTLPEAFGALIILVAIYLGATSTVRPSKNSAAVTSTAGP